MSGLAAAAPTSAPPPTPRSMSTMREGDSVTWVARMPAPITPMAEP